MTFVRTMTVTKCIVNYIFSDVKCCVGFVYALFSLFSHSPSTIKKSGALSTCWKLTKELTKYKSIAASPSIMPLYLRTALTKIPAYTAVPIIPMFINWFSHSLWALA
jgi:hypothetical protein